MRKGNIIFILIALILIGIFANYMASVYLNYKISKSFEHTFRKALNWGTWQDGSAAYGGDEKWITEAYLKLQKNAALLGEAPRNNKMLHILAVRYDFPDKNKKNQAAKSFSPLTLDVKGLKKAGVVLIYDGPTALRIANARFEQRAKLALEGQAPVIPAEEIPEGFISAMRIEGFGLGKARNPRDIDERPIQFCHAMEYWLRAYYIHPENATIWKARIPKSGGTLTLSDGGISASLGETTGYFSLLDFCENNDFRFQLGFGND